VAEIFNVTDENKFVFNTISEKKLKK